MENRSFKEMLKTQEVVRTTIHPHQAIFLLSNNGQNRVMSPSRLALYESNLKKGEWEFNGQSISISKKGVLLNGQHRLQAIVNSGFSMEAVVCFGVEDDSYKTIDQGKKRNSADFISRLNSSITFVEATTLSSAFHWNDRYQAKVLLTRRGKLSIEQIEKNMEDPCWIELARKIKKIPKKLRFFIPQAIILCLFYYFFKIEEGLAEYFFKKLLTGENLSLNNIVFRLRNDIQSDKNNNNKNYQNKNGEIFMKIIKCWNWMLKNNFYKRQYCKVLEVKSCQVFTIKDEEFHCNILGIDDI